VANMQSTGADGVMSAEGILDDPTLFLPTVAEDVAAPAESSAVGSAVDGQTAVHDERKLKKKLREIERLEAKEALTDEERLKVAKRDVLRKQLKRCQKSAAAAAASSSSGGGAAALAREVPPKPSPLSLALEYIELAVQWGVPVRTVVFHVRRLAKAPLSAFQLMAEMLDARDVPSVRAIVHKAVEYETNGYTPDPEKAKREREALELKKWREATRKRYEERLTRKAMRSGLPHDHYLMQGAEVPTAEGLGELRAMPPAAAWERWKERHAQHCWAFHLDDGGCSRARTCAFLHADVAGASEPAWHG